ncbi:acriflavin resistance protein [Betaproteobacteria bacterium]|nr:acriflavin resistance protein [Betaproteobacteria bacterium]GHU22523.1 acriflavin resistance protein [Betaproteobacteria bacterium]GHU31131.1 acriflavin resistance protein [Betaproteobacteria bacterium]
MSPARLIPFTLIALAGAAVWWLNRPQPLVVTVHEVGHGKVEATVINTRAGEVEACQRTKLSTIVSGRIDYLPVKEGDRVAAGQVLMRLWQGDLEAERAVTQAQLAAARQRQSEACVLATNAGIEAKRQVALVARGFVSASVEEKASTEAAARAATCASAAAEVSAAARQLDAIATQLERTVIVAPFAGTVAKINGELGEISTPSPTGISTPPAIDLINDSCLYVKAPMDEVDAPRIAPGQPARISFEALPGKTFAGHVRRVAPYITAVEKQARTVAVDIDFEHPEEARGLLVGYSVDVEIILASRDNTLRIPTAALREGNRVWVRGKDGVVIERTIEAGIANWEQTEIVAGLSAGEKIITSFAQDLAPGVHTRTADGPD